MYGKYSYATWEAQIMESAQVEKWSMMMGRKYPDNEDIDIMDELENFLVRPPSSW